MLHIFFDLDRTLWDFDSNSRQTLESLYQEFKLADYGIRQAPFITKYQKINKSFWAKFQHGKIDRESLRVDRFYNTLRDFGIENVALASKIADYYLSECPKKSGLMPNALKIVDQLSKQYQLHIISNGFTETQKVKLESSGLSQYFKHVITSDSAQAQKPSTKIFNTAWELAGKPNKELCFYIGDDWNADVRGAKQFGFTPIWFSNEYRKTKVLQTYDMLDIPDLLRNAS